MLLQLCLMSGEVIQMSPPMTMLFETMDLSQASVNDLCIPLSPFFLLPSTVSFFMQLISQLYTESLEVSVNYFCSSIFTIQLFGVLFFIFQPATVSRCGMIYLEPSSLGWRPLKKSWENNLPKVLTEGNSDLLEDMFEWLVDPCLTFVRKNCKVRACTAYNYILSIRKTLFFLRKFIIVFQNTAFSRLCSVRCALRKL